MSESEEVGVGVGESPQAPSKVETGRNVPSRLVPTKKFIARNWEMFFGAYTIHVPVPLPEGLPNIT